MRNIKPALKRVTFSFLFFSCLQIFCGADDLILASETSRATIALGSSATSVEKYAGVQTEVANRIAKWWDQTPFIDIVHFYHADNQGYCQDSLCKALASGVSTRWQKFSQIVME